MYGNLQDDNGIDTNSNVIGHILYEQVANRGTSAFYGILFRAQFLRTVKNTPELPGY